MGGGQLKWGVPLEMEMEMGICGVVIGAVSNGKVATGESPGNRIMPGLHQSQNNRNHA